MSPRSPSSTRGSTRRSHPRRRRTPLPARWREDWGIRRYGFHGLSVQWAAEQVRVARLVVCHLGGGCSVTAVRDGRSVDTTMGFSPLEGVPMATRSGSRRPGALALPAQRARPRRGRAGAHAELRVRAERARRRLRRHARRRTVGPRRRACCRTGTGVFVHRLVARRRSDGGRRGGPRRTRLHRRHRRGLGPRSRASVRTARLPRRPSSTRL